MNSSLEDLIGPNFANDMFSSNWQHKCHLMPYAVHIFALQMTCHLKLRWWPGSGTWPLFQLTIYVDSDEIGMNVSCHVKFMPF